jgi:hypothetical protein
MPHATRYDLLIDRRVRVALRTAHLSAFRRRQHSGDEGYRYLYRAWIFNFHHRGRITEQYCDFFICVPLLSPRIDLRTAYVIPWPARGGKMFYLPASHRPYGGKYAAYRNAWEQLRAPGRTGAAVTATAEGS